MSRTVKHTLAVTALLALTALASGATYAQPYGAYPDWSGMPPMEEEFGSGGPGGPGGYPWGQRQAQPAPADMLRDGVQKLTRFLDGKPSRPALEAYLARNVAPWFDFHYMAEWAIGPRIRYMESGQRADFTAQLRTSFLEKMAQKLARYSRQRAIFLPPEQEDYDEATLPVAIENPGGGYPARLEFHMRRTAQGWKVVDVSANGMSALMYYRELFSDMQRSRPPLPPRPY